MADYIYLLENRLSAAQQQALGLVRNAVRARDLTLFLTGGAVRDLTGGGSVRDLDVTVQGPVAELRPDLEAAGAMFLGENAPAQSLFFQFPGGVRMEVASALAVSYPKPGQPQYEPASITEDLRRRDFTANAMALSLNEGSYGLLLDPLNGVADIENRELRLISNYGFLDEPSRLIRAVRLGSRLGWQMEDRTRQRYENAKGDDAIASLSNFSRSYELEEIFHEEDPLRIMRALDGENWLGVLSPELLLGKASESALADLREKHGLLQTQGILADSAALAFPLLVAKLPVESVAALKGSFARPGFVSEIDGLEERARELQARFSSKEASQPSAAWRLLHQAEPAQVLAMFFTSKSGTVQSRIKTFLNDSPNARQKLPYGLLQEMRITPDMPVYNELLDKLFFELMDGNLQTTEELKAYLEPFSPPAPPPPINLRRARAKKEARPSRAKAKKGASVIQQEEQAGVAEGLMEEGTLTGPDRGPEPDTSTPLEGKVAPLAPNEVEPVAEKPAGIKPTMKKPGKVLTVAPPASLAAAAAESAVAEKLTASPAPAPEAATLVPHPGAAAEIAKTKSVLIPMQAEAAPAVAPKAPKDRDKSVRVSSPDRKAARTVLPPPSGTKPGSTKKETAEAISEPGRQLKQRKPVAAEAVSKKPVAAKVTPAKSIGTRGTGNKLVPLKKRAAVPAKSAARPAARTQPAKRSAVKKASASLAKPLSRKGAARSQTAPAPKKAAKAAAPSKALAKGAAKSSSKVAAKKSAKSAAKGTPAKIAKAAGKRR